MLQWLLVPFAYLLGSVSSAVIVSRLLQLPDPREEGSKNPGATNVLRLGGKKAAIVTLLGDMLKGLLPLLVGKGLGAPELIMAAAGIAAFLGHLYPVFFGFRGGKGVATALGVLLGFSWLTGAAVLLTWMLVAYVSRISSLSALIAAAMAPFYVGYWIGSWPLVAASVLMSALLIWRHRENIARIRSGTESRIGR